MKYLLDTCVISEVLKTRPNAQVVRWLNGCDESDLALSALTLGEIQKGAARLKDGKRKRSIQHWLDRDLRKRFAERILPIDDEVAMTWGRIQAAADARVEPMPTIDGLIGATAIRHHLTVVSRDEALARTGALFLNPWTCENT